MKHLQGSTDRIKSLQKQAVILHRRGKLSEAESIYRNILNEKPNPTDAANLGSLLRTTGRLNEAIKHYEDWISTFPEDLILRLNAINSGIELKDRDRCQKWLQEGKLYHEKKWELKRAEAQLEMICDNNEKAISILTELNKYIKNDIGILLDLSRAYIIIANTHQAEIVLNNILRLEPSNINAIHNLLRVYLRERKIVKFKRFLNKLNIETRQDPKVLSIEGDLLIETKKYQNAVSIFTSLCKLQPEVALNWVNLSACYKGSRKVVNAYVCAKIGYTLHPKNSLIRRSLIQAMVEQGKVEQAQAELMRDIQGNKHSVLSKVEIYNLQFIGNGYNLISSEILQEVSRTWEKNTITEYTKNIWADYILEKKRNRKLRIAYFSADFSNHPIGRFIYPLLKAHNRNAIKLIGLDCNSIQDDQNDKLRKICDEWYVVNELDSMKCARIISDLQIDVLIELGGFTANSRIDVLLHRPCKIQLSYLGYFAPTYLKCIDGWIGDKILFQSLNEVDRQQNLIMLAGGYMAFDKENKQKISAETNRRIINIGCFNHSRKITKKTVALYKEVLMTLKSEAKLMLKSISFVDKKEQRRVKMMFAQAGVEESRIQTLNCSQNHEEHMQAYNLVDFVVDPIPYGGATTTCEALIMGVPVVTYAGIGMVGQLSASILYYADCQEWICQSKGEYINKCKELAYLGPRTNNQRNQLREKVVASSLCNANRLANELEHVYSSAGVR